MRTNTYLEQQTNAGPRQASMDGVCIDGDIAHTFESIQPVYHFLGFFFQRDGSPGKCKCPPLLDAASLLLSRSQGLLERQIDVAGSRKDMILKDCTIAIR
jgi:hypothetical protein